MSAGQPEHDNRQSMQRIRRRPACENPHCAGAEAEVVVAAGAVAGEVAGIAGVVVAVVVGIVAAARVVGWVAGAVALTSLTLAVVTGYSVPHDSSSEGTVVADSRTPLPPQP